MAVERTLYTVVVKAHDNTEYTAKDTADSSNGRSALEQIKHEETVIIATDDKKVYIPWHSVVSATVTEEKSTIDMTDDACK